MLKGFAKGAAVTIATVALFPVVAPLAVVGVVAAAAVTPFKFLAKGPTPQAMATGNANAAYNQGVVDAQRANAAVQPITPVAQSAPVLERQFQRP